MENLLIYGSVFDMLDGLTNEEAGLLFKALNNFRKDIPVSFDDRYLQGIWIGILPNLNNLKKNYDKKVETNRKNGAKGGRPTSTENKTDLSNDKVKVVYEPTSTEIEAEIEDIDDEETIIDIIKKQPFSTIEVRLNNGLIVYVCDKYVDIWNKRKDNNYFINDMTKFNDQFMFSYRLEQIYNENNQIISML